MNRRDFLKTSLAAGALYSANGIPLLSKTAHAAGFAPLNERVLVNVMLSGGPDLRYLMPPAFNPATDSYGFRYWEAKANAHSIDNTPLAYQQRWENNYFSVSDNGINFGILKSCGWLKKMWDAGNVAIICNAAGARTRDHSHCQLVLNQGNLSSSPNDFNRSGWGGRLASEAGGNVLALTRTPSRFCFGPDPLNPENSSRDRVIAAKNTRNFNLYSPPAGDPVTSFRSVMTRSLQSYYAAKASGLDTNSPFLRPIAMEQSIRAFADQIDQRLNEVPLPTNIKLLARGIRISNAYLGEQIRNLYDSIAANDILSLRVASMELSGWDSHKNQRDLIDPHLQNLFGDNSAFSTLYNELPTETQDNLVLVFAGEFGRQLRANGASGSDHGTGNNIIIIGNGVNGGIYGDMFPEEELARLDIPNSDIKGLTEFDHILGRVADWVSPGSGDIVFPNRSTATIEAGVNFANLFS